MKNKLSILLAIAMVVLLNATAYAQSKVIKGVVKDASGLPVPGVNVLIKGGQKGVSTDLDGSYSINAAPGNVLVYSFIGFKKQEITVGNANVYDVLLKEEDNSLEEVVVVGYGVKKKKDLTGSIVSVSSEVINSRPVQNAVQAMQGKAAGVDISSNERPGTVGKVTIRAPRSISASNSPLYVVDGIPINNAKPLAGALGTTIANSSDSNAGGIDFLNPNDIESIDVLKDASATAIYGSRGANGVIIVTTKKGKNGKFTLNYSTAVTTEKIHENAPMMSAGEYIEFRRWSRYYAAPTTTPKGDVPSITNDANIFLASSDSSAWANILKGWSKDAGGNDVWDGSKVATTDWTKFVTRTGITQQHTIAVSGGTEKMKGYGSFGYTGSTGTLKGQSFKRYSGIANVDITPTNWFSMGANLNTSYSLNEYGQSNIGRTSVNGTAGIYASARQNLPYAVPYDSNGNRIDFPGGDTTIRTVVDEDKYSQDQRITLRAFGSFYGQVEIGKLIPVLDGLKYRLNFGPDITSYRDGAYLDGKSSASGGKSSASLIKAQTISYTLDNLLFYNKSFGKHDFGLTFLQSKTVYNYEDSQMAANELKNPENKWNALTPANVNLSNYSSNLINSGLLSYMGRVTYGYDDKYLLTASGRYDGASQLAEGNKWDFFPSVSLAWNINKERFLNDVSWLDQLKLRAGFGVTANASVDPYSTKTRFTGIVYPSGSGLVNHQTLGNEDLGWEKTTQFNYGIDFSFINSRIAGSLEYYTSNTTDLILKPNIPTVTGFKDTYKNVGETKGNGVELTLNTINVKAKDFEWSSNLSASYQESEVVKLQNGNDILSTLFIGESQNVVYGYASNGIWKPEDAAEMAKFNAFSATPVFTFGNARPVDQNGDYKIDANNDRVVIGSTNPKYIGGLTNTFRYKNFELSFFIYGKSGYVFNAGGENQGGKTSQRSINYYNDNNTDAEYQKPIYSTGTGDPFFTTLGYEDGMFLKMRNISLGYNFTEDMATKAGVNKLRLYIQIMNPGMILTKTKWMDMDTQSTASNRGFTLGLNVEL